MSCSSCPRRCGADKMTNFGFCGAPDRFKAAKACLHKWEEPFISGKKGSGAVFFSHCNLRCAFCQNYKISAEGFGKELDEDELLQIMLRLAAVAENINLVTPTPYAHLLAPLLEKFKKQSDVPVVYNCGGYESVETLRRFDGLVDVYLPDMKYADGKIAAKYSCAEDYPAVNLAAVKEMKRQQPKDVFHDDLMKKGVAVRHLVLPNLTDQSLKVLDVIAENFGLDQHISLMAQYHPFHKALDMPEINRKITPREYRRVIGHALDLGFQNVLVQQMSSSDEKYVPCFDLSGLNGET